jgi:hypothetical protein
LYLYPDESSSLHAPNIFRNAAVTCGDFAMAKSFRETHKAGRRGNHTAPRKILSKFEVARPNP